MLEKNYNLVKEDHVLIIFFFISKTHGPKSTFVFSLKKEKVSGENVKIFQ